MPGKLPEPIKKYRSFLNRVENYFDIPHNQVKYVINAPTTHDIASIPANNTLLFGTEWLKLKDEKDRKRRIIHEFLHLSKYHYPHAEFMRKRGYFSHPSKDKLSWRLKAEIDKGVKEFRPERFKLPTHHVGNPDSRNFLNLRNDLLGEFQVFEDDPYDASSMIEDVESLRDKYDQVFEDEYDKGKIDREERDRLFTILNNTYHEKHDEIKGQIYSEQEEYLDAYRSGGEKYDAEQLRDWVGRMKQGEDFSQYLEGMPSEPVDEEMMRGKPWEKKWENPGKVRVIGIGILAIVALKLVSCARS